MRLARTVKHCSKSLNTDAIVLCHILNHTIRQSKCVSTDRIFMTCNGKPTKITLGVATDLLYICQCLECLDRMPCCY